MTPDKGRNKIRTPASNSEDFAYPADDWPTVSGSRQPTDQAEAYSLRGIGALLGGLLGSDIARSVVGSASWRDEAVAVFLGIAGIGIANQFILRLCGDRPKLSDGTPSAGVAGGGLGLGWVALGAAGISVLDGGILLASVLVPVGARMLANRRGGTKVCPHCKERQSCSHAVCRNCLRVFFPAPTPNCATTFFLDWFAVVSFLQVQGLNYFEARDLFRKSYSEDVKNGKVDCVEFLRWAQRQRKEILDSQGTIAASEKKHAELDRLGL